VASYRKIKECEGKCTKMIKDYYTVKDIADQLQLKEKTVRRLLATGKLKASKVCGKWVVSAENLKAFIDGHLFLRK
jgi:excisionase family DNA binding protein